MPKKSYMGGKDHVGAVYLGFALYECGNGKSWLFYDRISVAIVSVA